MQRAHSRDSQALVDTRARAPHAPLPAALLCSALLIWDPCPPRACARAISYRLEELAEAHEEREAAVLELAEERTQREAAELLLRDVFGEMRGLKERNALLEQAVATLLYEREASLPEDGAASSPGASVRRAAAAESAPGFDLASTRSAIEEAVREAAACPEDERRRKIRQLRLKWHPDKLEVLKGIAEEVTKIINEAVDKYCGGSE